MYVAQLRYIQSIHEEPDRTNPDVLVRHFIPLLDRLRWTWLASAKLSQLRADPFYYYLVARTRYYDHVFTHAIESGVRQIVMIGCGTDTRSYRFSDRLEAHRIRVLECDQRPSIELRQRMTRRWRRAATVEYLAIDLNNDNWPELGRWLGRQSGGKTLVIMEGVSPYIDECSFGSFLSFLSTSLESGSHVAYDFKIRGVKDNFGREGRTRTPFRLPTVRTQISEFHAERGFRVDRLELSSELSARLLPTAVRSGSAPFTEDGLLRLEVSRT
jgi:methyltransferase (TIGR00027 family)